MFKIVFTTLLLFFSVQAPAQVFVPFSYWKGLAPLTVTSPSPLYIVAGYDSVITVTGGMGVYTWSNTAGDGSSITSTSDPDHFLDPSADYVARATNFATDVITVRSGSLTATVNVTTYALPLAISPTTWIMQVTPPGPTKTFVGGGGCLMGANCTGGAFAFSVVSGGGSITSPGGVFTAPAAPGTTVVQVADSIGNTATATITVVNVLTISPITLKIAVFSTNAFSAIAGTPAYTYTVIPGTGGTGTVVAGTGVYTAPSTTGTNTVRVTDTIPNTSDSAVTIIKPVDIKVGQYFACALYNEGSVKCWGQNTYGQLGLATGSTASVGNDATEIGGANLFVDLGTGRTATSIAVGYDHACALLDNATVKCWGRNSDGQLGKGNTTNLGDNIGEMGDSLTAINLGAGRTATEVYAFGYFSCAKLDDNSVKCWGDNLYGQMGVASTADVGNAANEMGDNLAAMSLGTGRTATKLAGGQYFVCALLDNATLKCWGRNNKGQLGKNNLFNLGDGANEMGDNLTAINVDGNGGAPRTVSDVVAGVEYVCVIRDNSTAICWGEGDAGELGDGDPGDGEYGDEAGEMAVRASINMGAGFATLTNLYTSSQNTCAKDNANMFKCWGRNNEGQLLVGDTTNVKTPPAAALNVGTGLVVSKFYSNYRTLCALITNDRIKCWGRGTDSGGGAAHGIFISTSAAHLGDNSPGEVGDNLGYINH